jgi:hypothetical protein
MSVGQPAARRALAAVSLRVRPRAAWAAIAGLMARTSALRQCSAQGGQVGTNSYDATTGGAAANGIGDTKFSGGSSPTSGAFSLAPSGGSGAGGPNGDGGCGRCLRDLCQLHRIRRRRSGRRYGGLRWRSRDRRWWCGRYDSQAGPQVQAAQTVLAVRRVHRQWRRRLRHQPGCGGSGWRWLAKSHASPSRQAEHADPALAAVLVAASLTLGTVERGRGWRRLWRRRRWWWRP